MSHSLIVDHNDPVPFQVLTYSRIVAIKITTYSGEEEKLGGMPRRKTGFATRCAKVGGYKPPPSFLLSSPWPSLEYGYLTRQDLPPL